MLARLIEFLPRRNTALVASLPYLLIAADRPSSVFGQIGMNRDLDTGPDMNWSRVRTQDSPHVWR